MRISALVIVSNSPFLSLLVGEGTFESRMAEIMSMWASASSSRLQMIEGVCDGCSIDDGM